MPTVMMVGKSIQTLSTNPVLRIATVIVNMHNDHTNASAMNKMLWVAEASLAVRTPLKPS